MRLRPLPLVLALASTLSFSFACADDDAPTVEPVDGSWNYFGMGVENNTCPVIVGIIEPGDTFLLDYDGGNTFDIEQFDQMDIECNLTGGKQFLCPEWLLESFPNPDVNVQLDLYVEIEGSFANDAEAEGEWRVRVDCVGDGCGIFDDIPCSYQLPFTAEAQ